MQFRIVLCSLLSLALRHVAATGSTDQLLDGDSAQAGYLNNHNMDPTVISGGAFGQLWQFKTTSSYAGQPEQFYAKPLVYTPSSGTRQVVLAFSEQNKLYVVDAVNGTLISSRDLGAEGEVPFLASDLGGCNDITGTIGITGTPVIDAASDTVYFWAKGYKPGQTGYLNGVYRFHAVDALTLAERPGFPTNMEGQTADNDASRYFIGGINLQRTSLNLVNGVVYAGFGGHCDFFNYTGWVVGMRAGNGEYVTGYATSGGLGSPAQGQPAGCGVWMSGAILASDKPGRLMFSTGNGYSAWVNGNAQASGRKYLATLSEAVVNLGIAGNGSLSQTDYFEPAAYKAMDAADRDLGSGGVSILPFSGGGVNAVATVCGKNGQCFVMNADNLGGFKMGAGGTDAILQTITPPSGDAIFGTVSSFPLEGGYIYIAPIGAPIYAYSLGYDGAGRPTFTYAGKTPKATTNRVAISGTTVTSLNDQPGTGILWVVDPDQGVQAFNAVPVGGVLTPIVLPPSPVLSRFQRLAFGNGRYYVTGPNYLLGYGAPVSLPFNCSGPINFGAVQIGSSSTQSIKCTALITTTITSLTTGNSWFNATFNDVPHGQLTPGQSFNFSVTLNLNGYVPPNAPAGSGTKLVPGIKSGAITLFTRNPSVGFATIQPISVSGQAISNGSVPSVNPLQVAFRPIVIGSADGLSGSASTFVLQNLGQSPMKILRYAYTKGNPTESDTTFTTVTTSSDGVSILDDNAYFTASDLPPVGTTVQGGASVAVRATFSTQQIGDHGTNFAIYTDGGMVFVLLTGSANSQPIARLAYSVTGADWTSVPNSPDTSVEFVRNIDFGTFSDATPQQLTIMITNTGGSDLIVTKSKPPISGAVAALDPNSDFNEGMAIPPGKNATAIVLFQPPASQLNGPSSDYSGLWTLNLNDMSWGVHVLNFTGTVQPKKTGPSLTDGSPRFKYLGCYQDSQTARIEPTTTTSSNNSNGYCQSFALTSKAAFAATEYMSECWVGRNIPSASLQVADSLCDGYACAGATTEGCGGVGSFAKMWYDVTAYFPQNNSLADAFKPPSYKKTVGQFNYLGCFYDNGAARTLSKGLGGSASNSYEYCASKCDGYAYFGVEYSNECYCGNNLGSPTKYPDTDCGMVCSGDSQELCGGPSRISLYGRNVTAGTSSSSTSGATSSTSTASSSATSSATSTPTGSPILAMDYAYVGCYPDDVTSRTLQGDAMVDPVGLTAEKCAAYCKVNNFKYMATEWSQECYCGNTIMNGAVSVTDGRCNMPCTGNTTQVCGGSNGISLFQLKSSSSLSSTNSAVTSSSSTSTTASDSSVLSTSSSTTTSAAASPTASISCPTSNGTIYTAANGKTFLLECYIDHQAGDMGSVMVNSYAEAVEACASEAGCVAFSWLPGVPNPSYMKNAVGKAQSNNGVWGAKLVTLPSSSTSSSSSSTSTFVSSTSSTISSSAPSSSSTSTSSSSTSVPSSSSTTSSSSSSSTSSSVTSTSSSLSSSSAVTSLSASSASTTTTSSTSASSSLTSTTISSSSSASSSTSASATLTSSFASASSSSSTPVSTSSISSTSTISTSSSSSSTSSTPTTSSTSNSFSSLTTSATTLSTSTTSSISSSTSTTSSTSSTLSSSNTSSTSSTSTTPTTTPTSLSQPWDYVGCANDSTSTRALTGPKLTLSNQTLTSCQSYCTSKGYPLAGTEYKTECYCGFTLSATSTLNQSGCTLPCGGNSSQICGGSSRISIYRNTTWVPPVVKNLTTSGMQLLGCYTDTASSRVLKKYSFVNTTGMSVDSCAAECSAKGYALAGVEYGQECYCDNVRPADGLLAKNQGECAVTLCSGDTSVYCGGGSRILVYA